MAVSRQLRTWFVVHSSEEEEVVPSAAGVALLSRSCTAVIAASHAFKAVESMVVVVVCT